MEVSIRFAACALVCVATACSVEPAPLHFELSAATREQLRDAPQVASRIARSLEELFGTAQSPRFAVLADGFDPNPRAPRENGDLTNADRRALPSANERAFALELEALARGDDEPSARIRRLPDLARACDEIVAAGNASSDPYFPGVHRDEIARLLRDWYPTLRESAELYRQECLHCHGVEGGGDGPTAPFLDPRPRDFQNGVFKFTSVKDHARPLRVDLLRTLEQGLPGTAMPNFQRLSLTQRQGLADYVRFLAIRGEVEIQLVATWKEEGELKDDAARDEYDSVWKKWRHASEKLVVYDGDVPRATPERIARGNALFHDALKGNCASCHGASGRGDGPVAYKIELSGQRSPAYVDTWGRPILPRDLTQGIFRGGSRPIDVYRRIYSGINGGPMPALGDTRNAKGEPLLSSDDLWCLVHYVRALAFGAEGS